MKAQTMARIALVIAIVCVVLAVVVIAFSEDLRRWYSGLFFSVMAAVMFINAVRWRRGANV